ncbi:FecR family protein [uncultured Mucilaginibacter sp.]|uniref:FecR family protein n=1 Tax=uncultured Mucilaginibacter sp. TaxID=797541 RepID=UPI0025FE311E|nr:FecR family protein [uncultured Mucilaginibacter sp.]
MKRSEYLILFEKFLAGEASEEEIAKVMSYKDDLELAEADEMNAEERERGARILSGLNEATGHGVRSVRYLNTWLYVAAIILVLLVTGVYLWSNISSPKENNASYALKTNDVKPGIDKAVLKLANGEEVVLSKNTSGTLINQGGITVSKDKNGSLNYNISSAGKAKATSGYNVLTTPRGAEYRITLEDGTNVWLNSASTLKFPVAFTNSERRVQITGEAYFEVAKNKHKPFKVVFNDQEIEVLGTHFDVNAYDDEPDAKTTLLEGSVKVTRNGKRQILIPGEQAVSTRNQRGFAVNKVNIQDVIAWKNGFFQFRNASLVSIMRQASRWYDVDVIYEKGFSPDEYGGRVTKYKNISELLNNLELTGTVHFKVVGRRIIVMK